MQHTQKGKQLWFKRLLGLGGLLCALLIVLLLLAWFSRLYWAGPVVSWWLERELSAGRVSVIVQQLDRHALALEKLEIDSAPALGIERLELRQALLSLDAEQPWYRPRAVQLRIEQLDYVGSLPESERQPAAPGPDIAHLLLEPGQIAGYLPLSMVVVESLRTRVRLPEGDLELAGRLRVSRGEQQTLQALLEGSLDGVELRWLLASGPEQIGSVMQQAGQSLLTLNHAVDAEGGVRGHLRADLPEVVRALLALQVWLPESVQQALLALQAAPLQLHQADLNANWRWPLLASSLDQMPEGETRLELALDVESMQQRFDGLLSFDWQHAQAEESRMALTLDGGLALQFEPLAAYLAPDWQINVQAALKGDEQLHWQQPEIKAQMHRPDRRIELRAQAPQWRSDQPLVADWQIDWQLLWPALQIDELTIGALSAQGSAHWLAEAHTLAVASARIESGQLSWSDWLQLEQLQVHSTAPFHWQPGRDIQAALQLDVAALGSPRLGLERSRWRDNRLRVDGSLAEEGVTVSGDLRLAAGQLGLDFQYQSLGDDQWTLDSRLQRLNFLQGSDFLEALLPEGAWPELLDVERGNLGLEAQIAMRGGQLGAEGVIDGRQLAGVYDRLLVRGLAFRLPFLWQDGHLAVSTELLRADLLNPGVEITDVSADSALDLPANESSGQFSINQMQARVAGGRAWVKPLTWLLDATSYSMVVAFEGLDLSALLALQSDTDISGTGTLDGEVPLRFSSAGVEVDAGRLRARPPGGTLQYRGGGADAARRSGDQRTDLVFLALSDFRFHELESAVDYSEDGTLNLGVRLHGHNPALQDGHPVHFNINLEQNLPMLLASLQLANQVNETIERRVRRMYQQN